jgi:hypothetical protein
VIKTFTESADSKSVVMSSRWSHGGNELAAGAGLEHTLRVYGFGAAAQEESEGIPSWIPGAMIFLAIASVVVVFIMVPVILKIKESGR